MKKSTLLETLESTFSQNPITVEHNKYYFVQNNNSLTTDSLDKIKSFFKKFNNFYYFLIYIISPVYTNYRPLKKHLKKQSGIKINLGSGNQILDSTLLNLDFIDYENVDIVADIHNLPFKDNSIDCYINVAVLEHVMEPKIVMNEMIRTLKPGGIIISVIPFMQPFHASPHDYQRYTLPGLVHLHNPLTVLEKGVFSGPFSSFLWVFQETIAVSLSFGNNKLRNIIYLIAMLFTFPIKFLDIIFNNFKTSQNIASNFYIVVKK
jgi:SAM-dependent methyltransferase